MAMAQIRREQPALIAAQREAYYLKHREAILARDRSRPARPTTTEQRKASRLRSRYGISLADFSLLCELQSGACGICKRTGLKLAVDHDHASGRVRGLLCVGCNTALGNLRDGDLFESAIIYLGKNKLNDSK